MARWSSSRCVSFLIGLLADLIGFNRQLLEITLEKVREMELKLTRMEEDRRGPRAARPDLAIATSHSDPHLIARTIADRSSRER